MNTAEVTNVEGINSCVIIIELITHSSQDTLSYSRQHYRVTRGISWSSTL